ncbi:MAG: TolC family protein, partial [Acidimicrobiia bacterium]|nr:TolC family protein [Acidimicrobiia bacterium]
MTNTPVRVLLCFSALAWPLPLAAQGTAVVNQTALPGSTTSVNTVSPSVQVQGGLTGSRRGAEPLAGPLTFREAIRRGLDHNLGAVNIARLVEEARGQQIVARSALLPAVAGEMAGTVQQINLAAMGFQFGDAFPGFDIPTVVGPFNYVDLRVRLTQTVFDLAGWNSYRAAGEQARAASLTADDTRDLVVLAVGGTYLQVTAAEARVVSAQAQLETAQAFHRQTVERREVGLAAQVDVGRSQIQVLTQQQRLVALRNDLAKQTINLARMVGLPPGQAFELAGEIGYSAAPLASVEEAVRLAAEHRSDVQAAAARLAAAERA